VNAKCKTLIPLPPGWQRVVQRSTTYQRAAIALGVPFSRLHAASKTYGVLTQRAKLHAARDISPQRARRDRAIAQLIRRGMSYAEIAQRYDMTPEGIRQIGRRQGVSSARSHS